MLLLVAISFFSRVCGMYLPGVAPTDYHKGAQVPLLVNALSSEESRSLIPYEYYYPKFHFCPPKLEEYARESLGSILFGDRLQTSAFDVSY
jgi:transmembrane 9 superfamily member 2/4